MRSRGGRRVGSWGEVNVKCTILMTGKATSIKVSQEDCRSIDTDPGEEASSFGGASHWQLLANSFL